MWLYVSTSLYYFFLPFGIDRITKYMVTAGIIADQHITSFLQIYTTYNRGISWGIGSSLHPTIFALISSVVFLVMIAFCVHAYQVRHDLVLFKTCLVIISGALSNMYDRIVFGGVIDFICFHIKCWIFPVFNVADIFIFCGVILHVFYSICYEKHNI